jgi:hypothetical protein
MSFDYIARRLSPILRTHSPSHIRYKSQDDFWWNWWYGGGIGPIH